MPSEINLLRICLIALVKASHMMQPKAKGPENTFHPFNQKNCKIHTKPKNTNEANGAIYTGARSGSRGASEELRKQPVRDDGASH